VLTNWKTSYSWISGRNYWENYWTYLF